MDVKYLFFGVVLMAVVTYVIRMIPMVLFRKKIENKFIQSFLFYVPYAVLSAMTFPAIFSSTESGLSSAIGCGVAVLLAYFNRSLIEVALGASAAALVVGMIFV